MLVLFLVSLVSSLTLLAAVSIEKNKRQGILSNFHFVEHPPNILRLCLLDLFTLFCQLMRLNISQQQSITTLNQSTSQEDFSPITFDTAASSPSSTDGRNLRITTGDLIEDDSITRSYVIDSDDAFHHNNVIVGLSLFQMLRSYNSRSQQQ